MSDDDRISVGDCVIVMFVGHSYNLEGVVVRTPGCPLDTYAIRKDDGTLVEVQMFETMWREDQQ